MKGLNPNFVVELLKTCLKNKRVLDTSMPHMKDSFFPNKDFKDVWSTICKYYIATGELITIGLLSQNFNDNIKVLEVIADIKDARVPGSDEILDQLGDFVKSSIFYEAYDKLSDIYNKGDKEKAFNLMKTASESIANFSVRGQYFTPLYGNFEKRHKERVASKSENKPSEKIPTGIDEFDRITYGGVDKGDTFLALAQSGVGKTKFLRHVGVSASRRGFKGLHVSGEDTLKANVAAYDACVAGQSFRDIEKANLDSRTLEKMKKASRNIRRMGGEVFVEAFEQFDTASISEVRNLIIEIEKVHGKLDFLCLDYLELFDPGDGKKYGTSNDQERKRRESTANKLKNIAIEFNIAIFSATQAATVDPSQLNDPEFVQTRYNISEFKGVIKPFSYFVTFNKTKDEEEKNIMRIYVDKIRKYAGGQTIKIYQRYDRERFYDGRKTRSELYTKMVA